MMKRQQRKTYSAEFKVKIALEAIRGPRTINEIASHFSVHPNQVTSGRSNLLKAYLVFSLTGEREPLLTTRLSRLGSISRSANSRSNWSDSKKVGLLS